MAKKLMAIDGHSLMYRAFHALPLLTNEKGEYTNAVYGFMNMLVRILQEEEPDYVLVALDMPGDTFRHKEFSEYKANRSAMPEELRPQFDMLKQALSAMGIAHIGRAGYEADDILGYTAKLATENGVDSLIVTGDRDTLQLVDEHNTVILTLRGITQTQNMDREAVKELLGVYPEHVADLKGLMGDTADNIPGVPGIGPKTANMLLDKFETLEGVLEHADEAGGKKRVESLHTYADQARLSKKLAIIQPDIPDGFQLEEVQFTFPEIEQIQPTFEALGFKSLLKRLSTAEHEELEQAEIKNEKPVIKIAVKDIESIEQLEGVVEEQLDKKQFAFYMTEEEITFAFEKETQYRVSVAHTLLLDALDLEKTLLALKPLFETKSMDKTVFDAKTLAHQLSHFGIKIAGNVDDVMLAGYSLNAAQGQYSLQKFCETYSIEMQEGQIGACAMLQLIEIMKRVIQQDDLTAIYDELELPLWRVLFDMEMQGFELDVTFLKQLEKEYREKLLTIEKRIYNHAGEEFNINSPKQLGVILFEKLGLPVIKKTKTGYSTNIEVLEELHDEHPIIQDIMDYRSSAKLKSTYIDGLLSVVDPSGKVHTSFTQNVTATGRISSIEPNLQNIPVRTEEGREIRKAFIPSKSDRVLVCADYSQIELRLLAHFSKDEALQRIFLDGGDIHTSTAAEVFGVPVEFVTSQMRRAAKAVNFGIIYGISDFGLARNLGIPIQEAKEYIETYLARYPGVEKYLKQSVADARRKGFASTIMGRRRYMPELSSSNYNTRSFGERVAMNAPLQGSAADIIKLAMIRVTDYLKEEKLDGVLILQVHDELIIDCHESIQQNIVHALKELMEGVVKLSVPLVADAKSGKSWLDAQ